MLGWNPQGAKLPQGLQRSEAWFFSVPRRVPSLTVPACEFCCQLNQQKQRKGMTQSTCFCGKTTSKKMKLDDKFCILSFCKNWRLIIAVGVSFFQTQFGASLCNFAENPSLRGQGLFHWTRGRCIVFRCYRVGLHWKTPARLYILSLTWEMKLQTCPLKFGQHIFKSSRKSQWQKSQVVAQNQVSHEKKNLLLSIILAG